MSPFPRWRSLFMLLHFLVNLKGKETVAQRRQSYVIILGRKYMNKGRTVWEEKEIET